MRGWLACHPPSHKGDKLSHFEAEIVIFFISIPLPISGVAGEVFYMLLGISLFEGNMVASGFESYLVALCFILWEGACTGSYRTQSYDK